MELIFVVLHLALLVISSGAIINLIKDGGVRSQDVGVVSRYDGVLNYAPLIWFSITAVVIALIIVRRGKVLKIDFMAGGVMLFCGLSALWAAVPTTAIRTAATCLLSLVFISYTCKIFGREWLATLLERVILFAQFFNLGFIIFFPAYAVGFGDSGGSYWQGIFDHKNGLGHFSAFSLLYLTWRMRKAKVVYLCPTILVSCILILGSGSSTALIASVLGETALVVSRWFPRLFIRRLKFLLVAIALVSGFFLIWASISGFDFPLLGKDSTLSGRNLIWAHLVAKVSESPMLGYGFDQIGVIDENGVSQISKEVGFAVYSGHNGFLEALYSVGVVGFLIASLLLVRLAFNASRLGSSMAFGFVIFVMILNFTESRFLSFNLYMVFLFYISALTRVDSAEGRLLCNRSVTSYGVA